MLVLEEQPKQDSVRNNPSNIPELDTQPAENESLPDHKSNYERKEVKKMKFLWFILTMLMTIYLLSIFHLTSHHHLLITKDSVMVAT